MDIVLMFLFFNIKFRRMVIELICKIKDTFCFRNLLFIHKFRINIIFHRTLVFEHK